jgi:hypothetical protein
MTGVPVLIASLLRWIKTSLALGPKGKGRSIYFFLRGLKALPASISRLARPFCRCQRRSSFWLRYGNPAWHKMVCWKSISWGLSKAILVALLTKRCWVLLIFFALLYLPVGYLTILSLFVVPWKRFLIKIREAFDCESGAPRNLCVRRCLWFLDLHGQVCFIGQK